MERLEQHLRKASIAQLPPVTLVQCAMALNGWTQTDLARWLEVSAPYLSMVMKGRPPSKRIKRSLARLGVPEERWQG